MARADKNNTRKAPETDKSVSNTSPPIGKRHEVSIGIQQAQRVSLPMMMWMRWVRAAVAAGVARLRGRPPDYDLDAITKVAEGLARETGVDDFLDRFTARVRSECKNKRPRIRTPKRTRMREICRPIFDAARAQIAKK